MTQRQTPEGFPLLFGIWTFAATDECVARMKPTSSDSVVLLNMVFITICMWVISTYTCVKLLPTFARWLMSEISNRMSKISDRKFALMDDFRCVFLWDSSGTIVCPFFNIQRDMGPEKKKITHHMKPYLHPHQNNVSNALIEKDISETSICYLKEIRRQRNTSKISPAKG